MDYALYLNGVYEDVLEEIRKSQSKESGLICYLQPYASDAIVKLAESSPTFSSTITLYISLTTSLPFISYRAEICGWEDKSKIKSQRLEFLNSHIQKYQTNEKEIYMIGGQGKPAVNLISVINIERLGNV